MHHAAVWQHSSNSNIKIVYNYWTFSVESTWFLFWWCPLLSVDCFHKLCLSGTASENWQAVWDLGKRMGRGYWVDMRWIHPMRSYARGIQGFCSVWEMRRHLISRTEHLKTSDITSHGTGSFCVKLITPVLPNPKISTRLTIFWGGTWKKEFVKTICRQERTSSENKSDGFHKKSSIELWTILMFELLLCCHTAARCMEWT